MIIDTSEIIDSTVKLLATNKILTFYSDDKAFLINAPNGSFLNKLSNNKEYCHLSTASFLDYIDLFDKRGIYSHYFFTKELSIAYSMSALSSYAFDLVSFVKSKIYYETLNVFYYRKNLEKDKKAFIDKR